MIVLVNVMTMGDDGRPNIVHVETPDQESADLLVYDMKRDLGIRQEEIAVAHVGDNWKCEAHSESLRCGMPLLN